MQSSAASVTAYLNEVPDGCRDVLTSLRDLCVECLPGYREGMDYGMPSYAKNGSVEVAFASQKNYISLYVLKKKVVDDHRGELVGTSIGKGCIRFSKPEKIDFKIVKKLLIATRKSKEPVC
jgi:uncharacterized protein YdhG (YjbR/CyaY superfamily)